MNYISLFSGANGGDLAFQHLLKGFRCVGYVDNEPYCQAITRQRISDGLLDDAPIFSCIKDFISQGYAEAYQGMVDVVAAGFPCQPFSQAGHGKAECDERNMWPYTIESIRIIRPKLILLENVTGLFVHEYIWHILADITKAGFHTQWTTLSAKDIGGKHKRERWWLMAYPNSCGLQRGISNILGGKKFIQVPNKVAKNCYGESLQKDGRIWPSESEFRRVVDDFPNWVDRLKAIGNGQVPQVAATAWEILKPL